MIAMTTLTEWEKGWVTGLVEGEGSFVIFFWKFPRAKFGVVVRPEFAMTIHRKDEQILRKLKDFFGGNINDKTDTCLHFRVSKFDECLKIAEFFEENKMVGKKIEDFKLWKMCLEKMKNFEHRTLEGLMEIARLREKINLTKRNRRTVNLRMIKEWVNEHVSNKGIGVLNG